MQGYSSCNEVVGTPGGYRENAHKIKERIDVFPLPDAPINKTWRIRISKFLRVCKASRVNTFFFMVSRPSLEC